MRIQSSRLEAFSDGVMSIMITILAFSIPLPQTFAMEEMSSFLTSIGVFFVTFIVVGTQWANHNYLFHFYDEVSSKVLWRNILYLFFLALLPLFTKLMMENPGKVVPAIGYDMVFLAVLISFHMVRNAMMKECPNEYYEQLKRVRGGRAQMTRLFILMLLGIAGILILSVFYPTLSMIFFLGFPVTSSLLNLWTEGKARLHMGKRQIFQDSFHNTNITIS